MYKRTIKYTDYNGVEREEDFYFNLNKAELIEMEVGPAEGLEEHFRKIIASKNGALIMKTFKDFILKSYGEKSPDGKNFFKSEEISNNFLCSEAYNELFCQICTDAEEAAKFVNAVLPLTEEQRQIVYNSIKEKEEATKEKESAKVEEIPVDDNK